MSEGASTYGWDTVYALRIGVVNTALREARPPPWPSGFETRAGLGGVRFRASFGVWQIAPGGSGEVVRMRLPLEGLRLMLGEKDVPLGNAEVEIEVRLAFVNELGQLHVSGSSGTRHLVLGGRGDPSEQAVAVVSVGCLDGSHLDATVQAALRADLGAWLTEHLPAFAHVFAVVQLGARAESGAFAWLHPMDIGYAYCENAQDPEASMLAVLCTTGERRASRLLAQVSEHAIPPGCSGGFLISHERLLDDLIRPALPSIFEGSNVADFRLSDDGRALVLARSQVRLKDMVVAPADGHPAQSLPVQLLSLRITLFGTELRVESLARCEISPGLYSIGESRSRYGMALSETKGQQTLAWTAIGQPETHHETSAAVEILIAKGLAVAAGVAATALLAALTSGAALIAAGAVLALVCGVSQALPDIIRTGGKDLSPAPDLLVLNAIHPIQWADAEEFRLTSAALCESLRLGGTPHPLALSPQGGST